MTHNNEDLEEIAMLVQSIDKLFEMHKCKPHNEVNAMLSLIGMLSTIDCTDEEIEYNKKAMVKALRLSMKEHESIEKELRKKNDIT